MIAKVRASIQQEHSTPHFIARAVSAINYDDIKDLSVEFVLLQDSNELAIMRDIRAIFTPGPVS